MINTDLSAIINLIAYPITEPHSADYLQCVKRLQVQLQEQQFCVLPGFLIDEARCSAVQQTLEAMPQGYRNTSTRNCYLQRSGDSSQPANHPGNVMFDASYTMLAADVLPAEFALKKMYASAQMIRFVCDITQSPQLYVSQDRYQPVNVLCSKAGDNSAWHFDSWNAFTMTLLLQSPEFGGNFQLVPAIRSRENANEAELSTILLGDESKVVTVSREPGSLVIFRGSTSVHRVTEVKGNRLRLMGVFVYEEKPGVVGEPHVNETVYGPRVAASKD